MNIRFVAELSAEHVAIAVAEGLTFGPTGRALDARLDGALTRAAGIARFTGAAGQTVEILAPGDTQLARVILVGIGTADRVEPVGFERFGAAVTKRLVASGATSLTLVPETFGAVAASDAAARAGFGAMLGAYRFDKYRTRLKPEQRASLEEVSVMVDAPAGAIARFEPLKAVADAVCMARDLVNEPGNVLHPESFAAIIEGLSGSGLEVEVLGEERMAELGMNALLGVGLGSQRESKLVVMRWNGARNGAAKPFAMVGKGVTFDTGGISLKPGPGMEEMRGDMGGAAAVVGAMKALAARKARANVVGVVALVENMPDGKAQRPGDIVTSMSGQTIEVLNTDAEGRLILCDALTYVQRTFDPIAVVDLATLTGAILIALGHEYAGLFSNNDEFASAVKAAGQSEAEPVWQLPVGGAYDKLIDTPNADMKNIVGKPIAGSIAGAQFLHRFIEEGVMWAHLDIAGTAWKSGAEDPLTPHWATGYGVRLLNRLVADRYEE
jgi:leucyl aminopeptidase